MMLGSEEACLPRTEWRIGRKDGFVVNVFGVGGLAVEVPIARDGVGGWVGRRVRM